MSTSSKLPPQLKSQLPTSAATLFEESVSSANLRKAIDSQAPDYHAFSFEPRTVANPTPDDSDRPSQTQQFSLATASSGTKRYPEASKRFFPFATAASVSPAPPTANNTTTLAPAPVPAPHQPHSAAPAAPSTRSPRRPIDGHVTAYLHLSPLAVGEVLFDDASPFFALGGEKKTGAASTVASIKNVGEAGTNAAANFDEEIFRPLVLLRLGDRSCIVLLYKKLSEESGAPIAELLLRVVMLGGGEQEQGTVVVFFEAVDQAFVEEADLEGGNLLDEKRRSVMARRSIVSGREWGTIVLVSFTLAAESR